MTHTSTEFLTHIDTHTPCSWHACCSSTPLGHLGLAGKRQRTHHYRRTGLPRRNSLSAAQLGGHVAAAKAALASLQAELAAAAAAAAGDASEPDEAVVAAKDAKRLRKATALLAPSLLVGPARPLPSMPVAAGDEGRAVQPLQPPVGFAAIGGLMDAKRQLHEAVLLPLQHPQLAARLGITLPRGVLLHGPPGVGKTALVRALAAEVAAVTSRTSGHRPVALFARRGADCLGKYAGDAELHLRLLFQLAAQAAPAIIFLDELDGLVPPRSVR